ncbi:9155_t:CDS:2, partial [Paraglomus occultum]
GISITVNGVTVTICTTASRTGKFRIDKSPENNLVATGQVIDDCLSAERVSRGPGTKGGADSNRLGACEPLDCICPRQLHS